jgi:hypothetical protein
MKRKRMKISPAEIEGIRADLAKLKPPLNAVREMPIKDIIMALAPELQGMASRGYTTDGLLEELKKYKISITGRSLNCYLKEFREGRREARKRGRKAASAVENPASPSAAAQPRAGNFFTPGEERNATPVAPATPYGESWREELKDLV